MLRLLDTNFVAPRVPKSSDYITKEDFFDAFIDALYASIIADTRCWGIEGRSAAEVK
jgi:hypothetical protein